MVVISYCQFVLGDPFPTTRTSIEREGMDKVHSCSSSHTGNSSPSHTCGCDISSKRWICYWWFSTSFLCAQGCGGYLFLHIFPTLHIYHSSWDSPNGFHCLESAQGNMLSKVWYLQSLCSAASYNMGLISCILLHIHTFSPPPPALWYI